MFLPACAKNAPLVRRTMQVMINRGDNTECDATLCDVNEYVSSNACVACDPRRINTAGDDASGSDTECDKCAENYYVDSENCLSCPTGTTNVAGDSVDGGNTECGECAENYYVSADECKECPPGMTNVAGDIIGWKYDMRRHLMFC